MSNYFIRSMIFLLFSGVLYAALMHPWYVEARAKHDHVQFLNEVLAQVNSLNRRRDELLSEFNSIPQNKVALIRNAVPPHSPKNVILFLLALDVFVAQSGLSSDTPYAIGSEETNPETSTVAVPIQFDFSAVDYDVLTRFIANLQRWERAVRIESVTVSAISGDGRLPNAVRASVSIHALFSSEVEDQSS